MIANNMSEANDAPKTMHTPGPWVAEAVMSETDLELDICLGYQIPGAGHPIVIGFAYGPDVYTGPGSITKGEGEANARLMAAAPDLLRELTTFHDYAIQLGIHDCGQDGQPCPVQAAIDKATGAKS